jgi:tRNA threonylcarbamoyladenosine biosynthesis protein TsaE
VRARLEPERLTSSAFRLPTRRATLRLAERIGAALAPGDLLVLSGDLGVGKTFMVRAMCRALGIGAKVAVTSPSFALVNELCGRVPIVHVDLYRLDAARDVLMLGLAERREGAVMLVEWGAPFVAELGGGAVHLELSIIEPSDERVASLRHEGAEGALERILAQCVVSTGARP